MLGSGLFILGVLTWRPHLPAVVSGLLTAVLAGWIFLIYSRMRSRMTRRQALLLVAPKVAAALLLVVALLDPLWGRSVTIAPVNRVLAVVDVSSSMDVKDDGRQSRLERAAILLDGIRKALPPGMVLQTMEFDTGLREWDGRAGGKRDSRELRNTDLGGTLLALAKRADLSSHAAVILITDGGDEPVENAELPASPLYVVGVGGDLAGVGDLAVGDVQCPPAVEKNATFELSVDVSARNGGGLAGVDLSKVAVTLEREQDGQWQRESAQAANLSHGWARLTFRTSCPAPGLQQFRVSLARMAGEISFLNNRRTFGVDVRKKTLHVLFFARELGAELKMLRGELIRDAGVTFTALYRTSGERFTVQGGKFPGDDKLDAGFPADLETLKYFDCVIIDSAADGGWHENQLKALQGYVENGGAAVFLGDASFAGGNGLEAQLLGPLLPWEMPEPRQEMLRGEYPVSLPLATANHPVVAGLSPLIAQAAGAVVESVCRTGPAKPGATTLMTVVVDRRAAPLVALQRYGRGNVMAIASNTLWKWARQPGDLEKAYGQFWRQAVRNLAAGAEGGQLLAVKWSGEKYQPGDQASAEIRPLVADAEQTLEFAATVSGGGMTKRLPVEPIQGQPGSYRVKHVFAKRGIYHFSLLARQHGSVLETYDREFPVGTLAGEGTRLELDDAALRRLAQRGGGVYFDEHEASRIVQELTAKNLTRTVLSEASPLSDAPWFAVLFLMVLVAEWILRRRMNLF